MDQIEAKRPSECSQEEFQNFVSLVREGGEVDERNLETRARASHRLFFLTERNCLIGVAALKNPSGTYRQSVFQKANVSISDAAYPLELGWVFVSPNSRGKGLSYKLVDAAVSVAEGEGVFSTSRLDNIPMHKALEAHGLSRHGSAYASRREGQQLILFLSGAVQSA
jgi:GNAT superfamily N-acetyltransferase